AVKMDGSQFSGTDHPFVTTARTGKAVRDVNMGIVNLKTKECCWIRMTSEPLHKTDNKTTTAVFITFCDITEYIRMNTELENFRCAVENSTNAVDISTAEGKHYYKNKAFEDLFGKIGKNPVSSIFVDKKVGHAIFKTLLSGKKWSGEIKMFGKRKHLLDILLNAYPIKDYQKKIKGFVGIFSDLTSQKQQENALKESEFKLQQNINELEGIINAFPGMVSVVDRKYNVLIANKNVIQTFGNSDKKEVIGKKCYRVRKKRNSICPQCGIKKAFKTGEVVTRVSVPEEEEMMGIVTKAYAAPLKDKKGKIWGGVEVIMDITDIRKAENELRQNEERFKTFIEQAADAVIVCDMNGKIVDTNKKSVEQLGYTREELLKRTVMELDLVYPTLEKCLDLWSNLGTGKSIQFESNHIKRDGTVFPVEINSSAIQINGEKHILGFVRDISDRKKAEQILEKNEKRFRSMIEHSADGITLINAEGKILYESPSAPLLTGYSIEERIAQNSFETIYHEDIEKVKTVFNSIVGEPGKSISYQFRGVKKDGSVWWVEATATNLLLDPDVHALVVNYRDISDRIEAEKALKKSEAHLSNAMKMAKIGYWEYDVMNDVFTFNDHFYEVFGTSAGKVGGYTMSAARYSELFVHPDDADVVAVETQKAMETDDPNYFRYLEHRTVNANGAVGYIAVQFGIVKDENGRTVLTRGANQDITKLKKAEEELKKQNEVFQALNEEYLTQNEELALHVKRIQKINEELNIAKFKAEESDKLKSAFLANMSHEIRTPMNGILGFADLLNDSDLPAEEQEKYIGVIKECGDRMVKIIDDIIDISKIDAGQIDLNIEPTNVNELINGFFDFFLPEAENKGLRLTCSKDISDSDSIISTDKIKLSQVLTNLIKNAIKFTDKGQIQFGYKCKPDVLEFFVKDTGNGIHKENFETIFERFRKEETSELNTIEGSGLGLSISKAYVEALNGKIWLNSAKGKGSEFFFTIPFKPLKRKKPEHEASRQVLDNKSKGSMILIVEDDDSSSIFLKEIIKKFGMEYIHAKDGKTALELAISKSNIDLILMDLKIPKMDGYTATKQIKKLHPEIPVIAQTAYSSPLDRKKAIEAGCDDIIIKPIDSRLLIELISKHLNLL
ncbi:MAG: PAS domain S-box protein, partial [Bacteroidales bacterium]|nr:PAS domain S-box protein [Bacteroidales bacterium]